MILFLDTTNREHAIIAFIDGNNVFTNKFRTPARLSETLGPRLVKFLRPKKFDLTDIKKIAVVKGPGSFVGIRTGVAYANALSRSLDVPVLGISGPQVPADLRDLNDLKYSKNLGSPSFAWGKNIVTPEYGSPPNITKPKNIRRPFSIQ